MDLTRIEKFGVPPQSCAPLLLREMRLAGDTRRVGLY